MGWSMMTLSTPVKKTYPCTGSLMRPAFFRSAIQQPPHRFPLPLWHQPLNGFLSDFYDEEHHQKSTSVFGGVTRAVGNSATLVG